LPERIATPIYPARMMSLRLANRDPSLESNQEKLGRHNDSTGEDKLNNAETNEDKKKPGSAKGTGSVKRKQPCSSHGGPMHNKRQAPPSAEVYLPTLEVTMNAQGDDAVASLMLPTRGQSFSCAYMLPLIYYVHLFDKTLR
jgi:hypothetical protein